MSTVDVENEDVVAVSTNSNMMMIAGLVGTVALVGGLLWRKKNKKESSKTSSPEISNFSSVAVSDAAYLGMNLTPESTHMDVLHYICTTPENIEAALKHYEKAESLKEERQEFLKKQEEEKQKEASKAADAFAMDDDDGGWADEGEGEGDDEQVKTVIAAAKKAEEEKKKLMKQVKEASGLVSTAERILIEGLDDGCLGQKWVEGELGKRGEWPPHLDDKIASIKFSLADKNGKVTAVPPLNHPAIRRNLCMTAGRLNSTLLNVHPELVEAGSKGKIDATYFKATMEFRQRTGLLLEAALRVAMSVRSYKLASTVIETVSMFKVGTKSHNDPKTIEWFRQNMSAQYGGEKGIPGLFIGERNIETPDENEIATDDFCTLMMEITRTHAENFTKRKIIQCQKQGIPPQVALNSYMEGWWIMIRAKRVSALDGSDDSEEADGLLRKNMESIQANELFKTLDTSIKQRFEAENYDKRLILAWPFIISNVAQQSGKVKVRFIAPSVPGKYKFYVSIKSQEFLGCDQELEFDVDVVDKATVVRKEKEAKEGEEAKDDEPKKEK